MFRLSILALTIAASPAFSLDISALAIKGNKAAIEELSALPNPTDDERMALGMFNFLRGIEVALQLRYEMNVNPAYMMLPIMDLRLPPNPEAGPFRAEAVGEFANGLIDHMSAARTALEPIAETSDAKMTVQLADLWFDLNKDGIRDGVHDVSVVDFATEIARGGFRGDDREGNFAPVSFDVADVYWLTAYTHVMQGFGETILAYDPTAAIQAIFDSHDQMAALNTGAGYGNAMDMQFGSFIDGFAAIQAALDQEPNVEHAQAAHANFLAMVDANRTFWKLVALETDNDGEWIPNDNQSAALGFNLPKGTGEIWMAVLEDGEKILNGELLIPYWRLDQGAGINLKKVFMEPRPVDLMGWIQGRAALPYAEQGTLISAQNWWRFQDLMAGQGGTFAVLLN